MGSLVSPEGLYDLARSAHWFLLHVIGECGVQQFLLTEHSSFTPVSTCTLLFTLHTIKFGGGIASLVVSRLRLCSVECHEL